MSRISTTWAMPSRWTFQIAPIAQFLERHLKGGVIVDPFCGMSELATHRNDLGRGGLPADLWCEKLVSEGVVADAVIFDPPYSPRQISECYEGVGLKAIRSDTQSSRLYASVRRSLSGLLRPGGIALSFGWQSSGFSRSAFQTVEILLVQHGSAHNDTICVAQVKRDTAANTIDAQVLSGSVVTEASTE